MTFKKWVLRKVTPKLRTEAQQEAENDHLAIGIVLMFLAFVCALLT